jgi:hypothetical protein
VYERSRPKFPKDRRKIRKNRLIQRVLQRRGSVPPEKFRPIAFRLHGPNFFPVKNVRPESCYDRIFFGRIFLGSKFEKSKKVPDKKLKLPKNFGSKIAWDGKIVQLTGTIRFPCLQPPLAIHSVLPAQENLQSFHLCVTGNGHYRNRGMPTRRGRQPPRAFHCHVCHRRSHLHKSIFPT